jgi:sulfate permease, SulP family
MQSFISFKNIRGDLFGGLTAGIVAIPLALAFGIQAFSNVDDPSAVMLGALAGITGAMMLGFFASLFGGTPAQVSGPTGPMTVITAGLVGAAYARFGNLESALTVVIISFLICGLFQIIFGLIRLGKYIRYIPYPVLSGFMSGIGLIIILLQIFPLFGMKSPATIIGVFGELPSVINAFSTSGAADGTADHSHHLPLPPHHQKSSVHPGRPARRQRAGNIYRLRRGTDHREDSFGIPCFPF